MIRAIRQVVRLRPQVRPMLSPRARWIVAAPTGKTYGHYLRVMSQAVARLYRGEISAGEFIDIMADVIPQQLTRAWNEGMRENGLDPAEEMTPEWRDQLEGIILSEFDYVDNFAAEILAGARDEVGVERFTQRAELWANRYNDVVNEAKLATADAKDKYIWVYGDTDHCSTCESLNGIVATAREWEQSGFHPQSPPNPLLICGGWKCGCSLQSTDKRRTANALEVLMDLATGQNV